MTERTRIGQACYRIAAQVVLLIDVLDYKPDHPKVKDLVKEFCVILPKCRAWGWPNNAHLSTPNGSRTQLALHRQSPSLPV